MMATQLGSPLSVQVTLEWQPQPSETWRSTELQQLLLKAAVGRDRTAIDAWQTWQAQIEIENLDEGSYWVLPRLYRNLQELAPTEVLSTSTVQRIKGVYRHVWSRNQMLLRALAEIVQSLQQAGIPVVILGGAALVTLPGADMGSRRADDGGVWVPFESVPAAIAQLKTLGWQPTQRLAPEVLRSQQTAMGLRRGNLSVSLQWRVLPECPALGAAGADYNDGISVKLGTLETVALNPTDQLFVCCIQATRWQPRPPFYWLADAAVLAQTYSINWPRLLHHASTHQLNLALRESLLLLEALLQNPDLTAAVQQLQAVPITHFERAEFDARARPHPLLGQLPLQWFEYQRLYPRQSYPQQLIGFTQFLQQRWGISSLWYIPLHAAKQGAKRILRSVWGQ